MGGGNKPPGGGQLEYGNTNLLDKKNTGFGITLEEAKESIRRRTEQIQCHCGLCIYCKERQKNKPK